MNEIIIASGMQVPTKAEITAKVNEIVNEVSKGDTSVLLAYGQLHAIKKACEEAMKKIFDTALDERMRYEKDDTRIHGVNIEVVESGVSYDYSMDKEWCDLQEQIDAMIYLRKKREENLRKNKQCTKTSKTTLKITH